MSGQPRGIKRRLLHKFLIDATLCAMQSCQRAEGGIDRLGEPMEGGAAEAEERLLLLDSGSSRLRKSLQGVQENLQGLLSKIRKSRTVRVGRSFGRVATVAESAIFSQIDSAVGTTGSQKITKSAGLEEEEESNLMYLSQPREDVSGNGISAEESPASFKSTSPRGVMVSKTGEPSFGSDSLALESISLDG